MVQANAFNLSRIQTTIVAVITSNLDLAEAPGNVLLPARLSGLPRDSVVNVPKILTLGITSRRSTDFDSSGTPSPRGHPSVQMRGSISAWHPVLLADFLKNAF